MPILKISEVSKSFFGIKALDRVSLHVDSQEILGLIGPNGSGKTTLFNCITGLYNLDGGRVQLENKDITNSPPHRIALKGLSRTFQLVEIYPALTLHENLVVALQEHQERNVLARILRFPHVNRAEELAQQKADQLLVEFNLIDKRNEPAGTLSYGQRKLLEFAAVMVSEPKIILLDEPAAAVNPTMIENMKEHIRIFNKRGVAFLIIEHNMGVIMDLCDRVVVLDHGVQIADGLPGEIQKNPLVLEAYFGK